MKKCNILSIMLTLLFLMQTSAAKPEVVIFRNSSSYSRQLSSKVTSYLSSKAKVTIKGVASSATVAAVAATKPAAIIALDDVSARSIQRSGSKGIPVIVGTDTKNYNALKSLGATFAERFSVDSTLTLALRETALNSVTFLYIEKDRGTISRTATRCRAREISVQHIAIADDSESSIIEALNKVSATSSLLYIPWNKKIHSVLKSNPHLLNTVASNSKAIISTSGSIVSLFKGNAHVFSIQRDIATVSAHIAETAAKAINSGTSNSGASKLFESAKLIRYLKRSGNVIGFSSESGKRAHKRAIAAAAKIKQLPDPIDVTTPANKSDTTTIKMVSATKDSTIVDTSWAEQALTKKKQDLTKKKPTIQKKSPQKRVVQKVVIDTTFITVTDEITNIFSEITPSLQLTGVAKKGDTFPLIHEDGEYLCINAWGKKGYIHSSSIEHKEISEIEVDVDTVVEESITKSEMTSEDYLEEYLILIIVSASLAMLLFITLLISSLKKRAIRKKLLYGRSALLLSKKPAKVLISDSAGETTTLSKFLKSLEVYLSPVKSLSSFQKYLAKHLPDLILVDWNMNHEIASIIKEQLSKYRLSSATTVLFYNVPDDDRAELTSGFGQATIYLHSDFPSVEKMELMLGEEKTTPLSKVKQNSDSHLYGVLGHSHLEEIIQLLGTSQKSGCLVVEDETPFAVIFFMNGFIVDATTRTGTKGTQAIFEALLMTEGSFNFILNRQTNAYTMQLSAIQLLMEWSQYQDQMLAIQAQQQAKQNSQE